MAAGKYQYRILVVGGGKNSIDSLSALLPKDNYEFVSHVESAVHASRAVLTTAYDLVVIITPLRDEYGIQLALKLADANYGVLILVDADHYDSTCYKVEDAGVMTMAKPLTRRGFYSSMRLLSALRGKLLAMEQKEKQLQKKMQDMNVINRAKWTLIENRHMTENEAHHYIERQAMNLRISRREAAETVLKEYMIE